MMDKIETQYNHKDCQSLFGYTQQVHERSGGICQLCNCGSGPEVDFDLWRQMTWEHIIGESQGGHLKQIHNAVAQRFQGLPDNELQRIAREIEAANTVTCCRFCNSTTSRDKAPLAMQDLIAMVAGGPEEVVAAVRAELEEILNAKKRCVSWKLASVKKAFEEQVAPKLNAVRQQVFMKTEHAL